MRLIIYLLFLLLFASCRSNKTVQSEVIENTSIDEQIQNERVSNSKIFDLLRSAYSVELKGVTVDFFPPDSAGGCNDSLLPDVRAAPRALNIENAKINKSEDAARLSTADLIVKETENLQADSGSEKKLDSRSDAKALSPPSWILALSVIIAAALICALCYFKFFRK